MQLIDSYGFYQSPRWLRTAEYIRKKYNYTCQKCGKKGVYIHHINPLTQQDYILRPVDKCYNEKNLTCLCHNCHEKEHTNKRIRNELYFDSEGQVQIKEEK